MKTLNLENMEKYGIHVTQNAPTNRFTPNNIPGVLVGIAVLTVCLQSLCTVKWSRSFSRFRPCTSGVLLGFLIFGRDGSLTLRDGKFHFCLSCFIKLLATSSTELLSYPFMISFDFD